MQCFGFALIRACILKSHCCRRVSGAHPPPPGWCHVCSAKHLQDSPTSFRWWKWGAPWPSGGVMRFYFKVSGISRFTLRMSIRPVTTRGLGFWLKKKKKTWNRVRPAVTVTLTSCFRSMVKSDLSGSSFTLLASLKRSIIRHWAANRKNVCLHVWLILDSWFLRLNNTHRTTRGMLRAQAAEKSGYLKTEGFSAKA